MDCFLIRPAASSQIAALNLKMNNLEDICDDLKRLRALDALSADLEAIERRPRLSLLQFADKQLDDWHRKQHDLPGRPEAVRRLVELGLKAKNK
jgi:hypothetical protein